MSDANKKIVHEPVLVDEVIDYLGISSFAPLNITDRKLVFIDATLGAGGHAKEMIRIGGFIFGIDDDVRMLKIARDVLEKACPPSLSKKAGCFKIIHGNFKDIDIIAEDNDIDKVDGILYDLGISANHLLDDDRGFSFQNSDLALDMRLNPDSQKVTASDLLNSLPKRKLDELFMSTMDYVEAKRLSKNTVSARLEKRIFTVGDFLQIIKKSLRPIKKVNVATKPLLALRMAVNSELDNLSESLSKAVSLLNKNGRLVVISFHSGEDRIVKRFFKEMSLAGKARLLTKKPIVPGEEEIKKNPMSRSAKLRAIAKK